MLGYIRENNTFGLKYYAEMKDTPFSDLLIQASMKTDNQLMDFSDYIRKDCLYTGISTGAYIVFYQGGTIDHATNVPGPVAQSSAESEYNISCTTGMNLAHFIMLIDEFLNKDPDIFP